MIYKRFFKRFFDLSVSIVVFLLFSPIFLVVMIVLAVVNNGNPFFTQVRPGKNEKLFKILKFKTMNDKKDVHGKLLHDNIRLTPTGKVIRMTSLDELPQLINVIRGDMSLIGPRPLLSRYLPYYTEEEKLRHTVRPGITGWAQVNGRNVSAWQDRLQSDVYYVKNLSLSLDLSIVLRTVKNVISAKDIVVSPASFMDALDVEREKKVC